MLILTRKLGESITIGENITVKVLSIRGNQVKLGIEAPLGMPVYREELYLQIKAENQRAATTRHQDISSTQALWKHWKPPETRRE